MKNSGGGVVPEVEVFAPGRADLAGGTLDLWPLFCFHADAVTVNTALGEGVRLRARWRPGSRVVRLQALGGEVEELEREAAARHLAAAVVFALVPDGGVEVEVYEQLPVGSGLGGSSVLAVALARACLALTGRHLPVGRLVAVLRDLEAGVLQTPTGCQDYYPALVGGTLAIHLAPGGERVQRLGHTHHWVEQRLAVVYTGVTHHSGMVNWEVYRRRVDGEEGVRKALDTVARAARACRAAILARDEEAVGRAIAAEWQARRTLAPQVSTPLLEGVIAAGLAAGALAGKACGAGGGGSVLLWTSPGCREAAANAALAATGFHSRRIATTARPPSLWVAAAVG